MKLKRNYPLLTLKGIAMGAADVIPGVSGGTIAFISGIYEELIDSIRSFDLTALRKLVKLDFKGFWSHINGTFLFSVLLGIGISIFSLAQVMKYLLDTHPIFVWSFFFGLIIASALLVSKEVKKWNLRTIAAGIVGIVAAYMITVLSPASTPDTWWFLMISGALAICAMILPGISGAFILLLLGKYSYIIGAVSDLNIPILLIFAVGAAVGIISFSHLLSWLLKKHNAVTVALLTGFMVGSLNKIWPWKETLSTFTDNQGVVQPLTESNILPSTFEQITGGDAMVIYAVLFAVIGFMVIWGIEKIAKAINAKREAK